MESSKKVEVIDLMVNNEYQPLLKGRPQTFGMRSGRVFLEAGQACGQHSTNDHEELLIFLAGSGQVVIDENEQFEVGQGKVIYIPPHTLHDVQNNMDEPLVYIYCVAPANQQTFKYCD